MRTLIIAATLFFVPLTAIAEEARVIDMDPIHVVANAPKPGLCWAPRTRTMHPCMADLAVRPATAAEVTEARTASMITKK